MTTSSASRSPPHGAPVPSLSGVEWREREGVRWLDAELPGARAAFSTRAGGTSEEPFASLNLAVLTGDELDRVRENRRRLAAVLSLRPERIVIGRQVHGAEVLHHDGPQAPSPFADPGPDPLPGEAAPSAPARGGISPLVDGHAFAVSYTHLTLPTTPYV